MGGCDALANLLGALRGMLQIIVRQKQQELLVGVAAGRVDFGKQIANGSGNAAEQAFLDFVAAVQRPESISTSATVIG